MRELRSSTTGNGWTINFDDIVEIVMEVRGGLSEISMEQVEDTILALGKLGYLKVPNTTNRSQSATTEIGRTAPDQKE